MTHHAPALWRVGVFFANQNIVYKMQKIVIVARGFFCYNEFDKTMPLYQINKEDLP